jgi:high-affinity Fe2+/Pb2+ permease
MNLDKFRDFFDKSGLHDLPTGVAALIGIVLLFLLFKARKSFSKVILFLVAAGLFAGAFWWHQQP